MLLLICKDVGFSSSLWTTLRRGCKSLNCKFVGGEWTVLPCNVLCAPVSATVFFYIKNKMVFLVVNTSTSISVLCCCVGAKSVESC
jgi:hypothetical protein